MSDDGFRGILAVDPRRVEHGDDRMITIAGVVPISALDLSAAMIPPEKALERQCEVGRALIDLANNVTPKEKEMLKALTVPERIARLERSYGAGGPPHGTTFIFEGGGPEELAPTLLEEGPLHTERDIGINVPAMVRGRGVVRLSDEEAVPWLELELREALPPFDHATEIVTDGPHVIVQALATDDDVGERLYLAALWWVSTTKLVDGVMVERVPVAGPGDIGVTVRTV